MKADINFDVPYPMPAALKEEVRLGQMALCLRQNLPKLSAVDIGDGVMSIACYGPTLKDTWQDLRHPIISVSGSHDFLIERGIIPDFHLDMDPRPHKLKHIFHPHKDIQYLMASVCHPFTWGILKGYNVKTWHVVSGKGTRAWLERYDPGSCLVAGGSSIGLAAIHVAGLLGYRRFEIFGMDGCWKGNDRHAGIHYGHSHDQIDFTANGHTWKTSKIMMNANTELINMLRHFPFFAILHGEGLQQDMVIDAGLENAAVHGTEMADLVRGATLKFNWERREVANG